MKEIDEMLNRWIYNSIIREELRELIIKEVNYKLNLLNKINNEKV
tara:strand:- start:383 stop:517 length:135 start_codon:yes stop_codon:yes gene_type:complete